ncbi:MAG: 2-oxoacid:acceptor oxidoreductase family protein, partial [Elusimicrobiota bacterium]
RDDLIYYPVPFARLAAHQISDFKLKKPLTNMIYVGVLAELLGIEQLAIEEALRHQLRSKEKAVNVNTDAVEIGRKYVRENFQKRDPYGLSRLDKTEGKILIEGNTASAMGALFGGCTVAAWYPITPASSLSESLEELMEQYRRDDSGRKNYAFVQAEDEIAAVGMALGAGWCGARAMTGTSGPGMSLMSEFVGYGYYAEVPFVIFNVQRIGPSTGLPTRTAQGDLLAAAYLSHGDTKHLLLIPSTVEECYEFGMLAFDLADRFQTPVFVLSDLDLGMNVWLTDRFEYPAKPFDRGKVLTEEQIKRLGKFERYRDVDGDGICYRTYPGNPHAAAAYFTRGSGHNERAAYTEDGLDYQRVLDRLLVKFETARKEMPPSEVNLVPGAKVGIIAYGSSDQAMAEARDLLTAGGLKTSYLKIRAFPFAVEPIRDFLKKHEKVFIVEQNRDAQMLGILKMEIGREAMKIKPILHYSGFPVPTEAIVEGVHNKHREAAETAPVGMEGGE